MSNIKQLFKENELDTLCKELNILNYNISELTGRYRRNQKLLGECIDVLSYYHGMSAPGGKATKMLQKIRKELSDD